MFFYKAKDALESYFEISDGQVTALSLEELERHVMHNDLSRRLTENYWAIDRNHDLLLGNSNANYGLERE